VLISKLNGCLFLFGRLGDHQLVRYCNRLLFAETEKVSRDLPNSILKFNGSFYFHLIVSCALTNPHLKGNIIRIFILQSRRRSRFYRSYLNWLLFCVTYLFCSINSAEVRVSKFLIYSL
jgi:hypothetical protein